MGRHRRMEKKNKTLGAERCANIVTLYINKYIKNIIFSNYYWCVKIKEKDETYELKTLQFYIDLIFPRFGTVSHII